MTPQERQDFEMLKQLVHQISRAEHVPFIESIRRQLAIDEEITSAIENISLTDLTDVDTTGVTNGQVIKYNSSNTRWEPGDDNTV